MREEPPSGKGDSVNGRSVIVLCCMMLSLAAAGCSSRFYERHVEPAYDVHGNPRPGWYTLNERYLNAIDADLEACYK